MSFNVVIAFLILFFEVFSGNISRKKFYLIFEGESSQNIEQLILTLEENPTQNAYLGALKMKLSGLIKSGPSKLKMFKEGKILLEEEINNNPNSVEWRFLRLVIQENAPKIVKYQNNLEQDSSFISTHFKSVDKELKKTIKKYATQSKTLTITNL